MSITKKTETKQQQDSTQQTKVDQNFQDSAQGFYDRSLEAANNYQPVLAPNLPGFNENQQEGMDRALSVAGQGSTLGGLQDAYAGYQNYSPLMVSAGSVNGSAGGFTPPNVSGASAFGAQVDRGDVRDIANDPAAAAQFDAQRFQEVQDGFNPVYTQQVIQRTLAENERQRQIVQNSNNQQAMAAGAFGGSRSGVLGSLTNEAFARQGLNTAANLELDRFNRASQFYSDDVGRQQQANLFNSDQALRAAQANQGVDFGVATGNADRTTQAGIATAGNQTRASIAAGQFATQAGIAGQNNALQAQIANQQAGLQAGALNQQQDRFSANLGMDATDRLLGLNSLERDRSLQDSDIFSRVGDTQYAQTLGNQNIDYQNALAEQRAPIDRLAIEQQGLANLPQNPTTTGNVSSSSTTKESTGGLGTYIGQAMQLGSMFAGGGLGGMALGAIGGGGGGFAPSSPSLLKASGGFTAPQINTGYQAQTLPGGVLSQPQPLNYRGYF